VVTNAERYHFADFTRDNYRRLLRLAGKTYVFRRFTDFSRDERFVIWRHDVDFSMHAAAKLARIEAEEGVRATYLIDFHSEFYNPLEREVSDCIREIASLGHELGIHFDSHYYDMAAESDLGRLLAIEQRTAEAIFERPFPVFSFHIASPLTQGCRQWSYAGLINANADYFQSEVGYCSDSNGYWRFRRLEDVLAAGEDARLQVLTHPEMWTDEVMSPRQRVERCIAGRADKTRRWYDETLRNAGRDNVDWDDPSERKDGA
jgi:hypothetical protein